MECPFGLQVVFLCVHPLLAYTRDGVPAAACGVLGQPFSSSYAPFGPSQGAGLPSSSWGLRPTYPSASWPISLTALTDDPQPPDRYPSAALTDKPQQTSSLSLIFVLSRRTLGAPPRRPSTAPWASAPPPPEGLGSGLQEKARRGTLAVPRILRIFAASIRTSSVDQPRVSEAPRWRCRYFVSFHTVISHVLYRFREEGRTLRQAR